MTFFQVTRCEPGRFAVRTKFTRLAMILADTHRIQICGTNQSGALSRYPIRWGEGKVCHSVIFAKVFCHKPFLPPSPRQAGSAALLWFRYAGPGTDAPYATWNRGVRFVTHASVFMRYEPSPRFRTRLASWV